MPVLPLNQADLSLAVGELLSARGMRAVPKWYAAVCDGSGLRASSRVELDPHAGPFICCGVSMNDDNVANGAGEKIQILADGRLITQPDLVEITALAADPAATRQTAPWPAPFYANGSMRFMVEATADPDGDDLLACGFHVDDEGLSYVRSVFGELRAFTLTLDSSGGGVSRDIFDVSEPMRVYRVVRTGDELATEDVRIRIGAHDLISRQGDGVGSLGLIGGSLGGGADSVIFADVSGARVEAVCNPDGTTPTSYLTFMAAAR